MPKNVISGVVHGLEAEVRADSTDLIQMFKWKVYFYTVNMFVLQKDVFAFSLGTPRAMLQYRKTL